MMETVQASQNAVASEYDAFEVHRLMVVSLFYATLLISVPLAVGLFFTDYNITADSQNRFRVTILMIVSMAGALGGFVSALRRLYAFQRVFPTNFFGRTRKINSYLIVYSLIPPLIGMIAAVVLYLIFAGGLIKGSVFPEFHMADPQTTTGSTQGPDAFRDFVTYWQPKSSMDYAKVIVWGFLAGFSERFVPDILGRIGDIKQDVKPATVSDGTQ
jgi:hypothetical protein